MTTDASISKDVRSIGERLSYCQCATCLPCLARVEIERLSQDVARYESGRQVLTLLIDTQRDKIRELEQKLVAAEQLAVRQGNTIRQLRRDASDDRQSAATEESWKNKQGDEYGSY